MDDQKVRADIKAGNEAAGAPVPKRPRDGKAALKRQDKSANKRVLSKEVKLAARKRDAADPSAPARKAAIRKRGKQRKS